jgi:putative membrane protein
MDEASQSDIAEIEEGRLALTHSRNPQVQALGNRLVQDHSQAQNTLEALARTMRVRLPVRPSAKQQQQIAELGGLEGAAFDKLFAASEVGAHRKAIMEMDRAAARVKNPALEAWIKESIPVLQEHLQLARGLPSQVALTRAAQSAAASR